MLQADNTNTHKHHFFRTPLAGLMGFIAVLFIMNAIITIWLNKALTDTATFVSKTAPLVETPEIQQFIAKRAAETIVDSAGNELDKLANQIVTQDQRTGKNPEQIKTLVEKEIETRILQAVSDPAFSRSWSQTIEQNHEYLVNQIKDDSETLTIDMTPVAQQAVAQLKRMDIGMAADELQIKDGQAKVTFARDQIGPMADAYDTLQTSMIVSIVGAIAAAIAAVILSVHHLKTLRRVLMFTGVFSLAMYGLLNLPYFVNTTNIDPVDQNAAIALFNAIFNDLKLTYLIVGILSIVAAVATKFVPKLRARAKSAQKS